MVVLNLLKQAMNVLIKQLQKDFPSLDFKEARTFAWSPKNRAILYIKEVANDKVARWSLLHEVGHAQLDHDSYNSDLELLLLEVEAWEKAKILAKKYAMYIDDEHIQNCLDTYRDWLYQRSTCPTCTATSLQTDKYTYRCINCETSWKVSGSRLCRPYRMSKTKQKEKMTQ